MITLTDSEKQLIIRALSALHATPDLTLEESRECLELFYQLSDAQGVTLVGITAQVNSLAFAERMEND